MYSFLALGIINKKSIQKEKLQSREQSMCAQLTFFFHISFERNYGADSK